MSVIIQIFGTKKCRETQKAIRYFKERNIAIQFINLEEKNLSKGELESVLRKINIEDLIDTDGKYYKENGYAHRLFDAFETLLEIPYLYRTPIVRFKGDASVGNTPEKWKQWADSLKGG
ncbi:MAG: ArsC family transcriptional regulator [Candidatus Kapabacteria bacterium]|nr:ArsC family transcriptional regulator [Candidatus Kapabacteria bacterium]